MTNVSKYALSPREKAKLLEQFNTFFARSPKSLRGALYTDLFTASEKIMFVKRLAIIFLLDKECSSYEISKLLHVSTTTVLVIQANMITGEYRHILKVMHAKSFDLERFIKGIDVLLHIMPPPGRGRWKWLYEMKDEPALARFLRLRRQAK